MSKWILVFLTFVTASKVFSRQTAPCEYSISVLENASSLFDSTVKESSNIEPPVRTNKLLWVTFGGGMLKNMLGGDLKATYAWGTSSVSMKVCGASTLGIFSPPSSEIMEYGLYYGALRYNEWGLVRIAAGPSYFSGWDDRHGDIHNFGLGGEAEAMLKYKSFGISVMITIMYHPNFFFAGAMINFDVGKIY